MRHRYEQIADELRQEIEDGRWPPGTRLPSTERLCSRFDVSSMTIRHAVDLLRLAGLVQTRRGAGVFVLNIARAELPRPCRSEQPVDRLITRLDELEARVLGDLAEIRDQDLAELGRRLDVIEARLADDDSGAPQTDDGREAPCAC